MHEFLIASCKNCGNSQLEVMITEKSLQTRCALCDLIVFEVHDLKKFLNEIGSGRCAKCHSQVFPEKLPN